MRLIDADALAEWLGITDVDCSKCAWGDHGFCRRGGDFEDACVGIEDAPTIDAVPVVRCRDCKHRYVGRDNVRFNLCMLNHNRGQPDGWFCADGEQKGDTDND